MPRRLPSAQALHAFDAAARHMSFTEAARELGITQAAVSQRIRLLEHQTGQALFIRHARALELTEAGRAFVPAVRDAFERLASGVEEAFGPEREGPVVLRSTPGFMRFWLVPRLARFQQAHPEVPLRLATAVWPGDFGGDEADMEIRYGQGDWSGVDVVRLTRERMTPVCTPAIAGTLAGPANLGEHTLVHATGFEAGWPQWLAEAGVPDLAGRTRSLLCDTMATSHALAGYGAGVAMGRSSFMPEAVADEALVAPFSLWLEVDEAFYLTRPGRAPVRDEAALLWDWLVAEAEPSA